MQGGLKVRLKAGQAVIYNGLLLHRGCTTATNRRLTLACNWNSVGANDMPSLLDARLSHQMRPEVGDAMPKPWMRHAWERWMATVVDDGLKDAQTTNRAARPVGRTKRSED